MKIATAQTTLPNTSKAFEACYHDLCTQLGDRPPDMLLLFTSCTHDLESLACSLPEHAPNVPIHGGTSCLGVMTQNAFASKDHTGMGMWGISDPEGSYGVGMAPIEDDPRRSGALAVKRAIVHAKRPGETPTMIWLTAAPGFEELVLKGIADVIGPQAPVFGGSTADNTVSGNWHQFTSGHIDNNSVILSVFYPSAQLSFAFEGGHTPTQHTWEVTRAQGRAILELDNQPAAKVYNAATQGLIDFALPDGDNILSKTTLFPLGRLSSSDEDIPRYLLSHPAEVTKDGALVLFSEVAQGEQVTLMRGSHHGLVQRAGDVAEFASALHAWSPNEIYGALVVYCAGCMLTIKPDMDRVVESVNTALNNRPFMGIFTFGEQGKLFTEGPNQHGNLMISAAIFGAP